MKRILSTMLIPCIFALTACAHTESVNFFHFTDNLNNIYGYEKIQLSDYLIKDNEYTLFFNEGESQFLLTLYEDGNAKIKKFRFTISKTDDNGNEKIVSDREAELFYRSALCILSAYSLFETEECDRILKKFLPSAGKDYSKTGELTTLWNNFSLIFYSNKLCCQFLVTDNYLEEPESTSKPVSRPLYGQTANIRED